MVDNNPLASLSDEEITFIEAVITDTTCELALDDEEKYVLFTDYEGDGEFFASVGFHGDADAFTDQEIRDNINEVLEEYDWFIVEETDDLQYHNNGSVSLYFYNERIRENVRDAVEEQL